MVYTKRVWLRTLAIAALALAGTAHSASGQPNVSIETPTNAAVVGQPFAIAGWAVDQSATATTGIDVVEVYTGSPASPVLLGNATAEARPDVAAYFQRPGWTLAGFRFIVTGLAPGSHQFGIRVHSSVSNAWTGPYVLSATIAAAPTVAIDALPVLTEPFVLSGVAGDPLATANSGIAAVDVWADRAGGISVNLGAARMNIYRPDATAYGAQYAYSGWDKVVTGLPPGQYVLRVRALSAISGLWSEAATAATPVVNDPRIAVDSPLNNALLAQPLAVVGVALDLAAPPGTTGVDLVRLSARAVGGGSTVALGTTVPNIARPDYQPVLSNNTQFLAIGFRFDNLSGLPPAEYDLITELHSTVSQEWTALVSRVRLDLVTAAPVATPPSGEYTAPIAVSVASTTPGAVIRYTLDTQAPTETSPVLTGAPSVSSAGTARVRAFAPGFFPSQTVDLSYSFRTGAPVMTPPPGTYEGPLSFSAPSATPGAVVRFTVDGTEPTETSPEFTGTIELFATVSPKLKAFRSGWLPSATVGGLYTILPASPRFSIPSGTYDNPQTIAIMTPTPGAVVRYTTDGSVPTAVSTLYVNPIALATAGTIQAKAFDSSGTGSALATLTIDYATGAPRLSPEPGVYAVAPINVTLASPTLAATIRYTVDGTAPGPSSPSVPSGGVVQIGITQTLRAQAVVQGWAASAVVEGLYELKAAEPVVTPASGTYARPFSVNAASGPFTLLTYTTDGSVPTASSIVWNGLTNPANGIYALTFRAFASGWTPSDIVVRQYEVVDAVAATPVMSPPPGDHDIGVIVSVTTSESGATLRVTTDGSDPTTASPMYAGPITVATSTTLKARAFKPASAPSNVAGGLYRLKLPPPSISPPAGTYAVAPQPVITHGMSGVTLRYSTDRSEPSAVSPQVPAACCVAITDGTTLKVRAFLTGWAPSDSTTNTYFVGSGVPAPSAALVTFSPPDQTVTMVGQPLSVAITVVPVIVSTVSVMRNGTDVTNLATVTATSVTLPNFVLSGKNRVQVSAVDVTGAAVGSEIELVGGATVFTAAVRASDNTSLSGAIVTLTGFGMPPQIIQTGIAGTAAFVVPAAFSGALSVQATGYHAAVVSSVSGSGATILLSPVNENFERGLSEWSLSYPAETQLRPHIEGLSPWICRLNCATSVFAADAADQDLLVGSWYAAANVTATRQFKVEPGSRAATVKFRLFSHTPAGWYRVTLTVPGTSQTPVVVSDTMQQLQQRGLATQGALNLQSVWLAASIALPPGAEQLSIELTLPPDTTPGYTANWLEIDRTAMGGILLIAPELFDQHPVGSTLKERLQFISLGERDAGSRAARVWGTLNFSGTYTFGGNPVQIASVSLELRESASGVLRRRIPLRPDAAATVIGQPFTSSGLSTGASRELFTLNDADMQAFSRTGEELLTASIHAVDSTGKDISTFGINTFAVQKLTDIRSTVGRYGGRDPDNCTGTAVTWPCLGDAWGRPTVHTVIEDAAAALAAPPQGVPSETMTVNDVSNMNAGYFPIHRAHKFGTHIDALITGYANRDASVARRMVRVAAAIHAAAASNGATLSRILVSYELNDAFATELANYQIAGVPASTFIRRDPSAVHRDHFHVELNVP